MRRFSIALLIAVAGGSTLLTTGCSGAPKTAEETRAEVFVKEEAPSSPSSASDVEQLEMWSGKRITLVGTFEHLNYKHGIIRLASGLKVYIPHFDNFMQGDDWFKYIGRKCWAKGTLHTYTKNIEGYRGPSLELNDFSGP
jgi:hypothetical protein